MKVAIEDIHIKERLRMDEGDLQTLAQSIEKIGLIQPVVISEEYELLSGYRRLHACKMLGWETIEVKLVTVGEDALKRLDWEYHENLGRKDLTPEEEQSYFSKRDAMLHPEPTSFWSTVKAFFARLFSIFRKKN